MRITALHHARPMQQISRIHADRVRFIDQPSLLLTDESRVRCSCGGEMPEVLRAIEEILPLHGHLLLAHLRVQIGHVIGRHIRAAT